MQEDIELINTFRQNISTNKNLNPVRKSNRLNLGNPTMANLGI